MDINTLVNQYKPLDQPHVIHGNELSAQEIMSLIELAVQIKAHALEYSTILHGNTIALIFEKPSLRTRFSFLTGIQAAGGIGIECSSDQLHKNKELPKDMIRVLQGYCNALIIRTHSEQIFYDLIEYSNIPIINGLSEHFHPCQILADFLTIYECCSTLQDITICYLGDGNNILQTLMIMAPQMGITIQYSCPKGHKPNQGILDQYCTSHNNRIIEFDTPQDAVRNADVVYTDVWTSMGFEATSHHDFADYQINEELMALAHPNAIFMHCLPMERGKEVNETVPESSQSRIFLQSQNRLYAQLALLILLLYRNNAQ